MAILRERKVWRRLPAPRAVERSAQLPVEQQQNVLAALRVLYVRFGTWRDVSHAMGLHKHALGRVMRGETKPSGGLAIRAAKLAGVSVEDVLSGAFGEPGKCPMCGHSKGQDSG